MDFICAEKRIRSRIKYQRLETRKYTHSYTMTLKIEKIMVSGVILRQTAL